MLVPDWGKVATVQFTWIGMGVKATLLFAVPPLISNVVLLVLLWRIERSSQGYEPSKKDGVKQK